MGFDILGCVMVVGHNFLELEVDESVGVKGTLELGWLRGCTQERTTTKIEICGDTNDPSATQVKREIVEPPWSCGRGERPRVSQLER